MHIEMELLARERYETRLREAAENYRHRSLAAEPQPGHVRAARRLPLPRTRQR